MSTSSNGTTLKTLEDSGRPGAEQRLKELGIKLPARSRRTGALSARRAHAEVHVLDADHFALDTAADESLHGWETLWPFRAQS